MDLKKRYSRSVAAIPKFNFWEATVMAFVLITGIRGLAGLSMAYLAFGPFAPIWHLVCIIAPILYMTGQFMEPPNGLFVTMFASIMISIGAFSAYAGLAIAMGSVVFTGFATLLVFAIGCGITTVQLFRQMSKLLSITNRLPKMKDEED